MNQRVPIDNLGMPPLAGVCTYEQASRPGFSVDETVARLKRYHYITRQLNQIAAAHLPATPEWEVKCALSLHIWLDSEHTDWLASRVREMREPPHHLDASPDERLEACLEEAIRAGNTVELITGIYQVIRPELIRALEAHLASANPLADHPTARLLKLMIQEQREMVAWGEQAAGALSRSGKAAEVRQAWEAHLRAYLQAAGGVSGDRQPPDGLDLPVPRADGRPYAMEAEPRRDSRITSSFDQSFSGEVSNELGEAMSPDERAFVLLHRRLQEMDVPEWMAPIIFKTQGKPWEYTVDMSRQLWDEARHAMLGEVGLYDLGIPFYKYPIALEGSASINLEFEPLEAHILLWEIEQRLMARTTGKRFEMEMAESSGNQLLVRFQDFDWADEVLHAQFGRRWLVPEVGSLARLRELAQDLRSRWHASMDHMKTQAQPLNWWPDFIEEARQRRPPSSE